MTRISRQAICAATLCFVSITASAAAEEHPLLEMKFDHDTREAPAEQYKGICPIRVASVVDARQNQETIGQSFDGALLSGDMGKWATDGLSDLKRYGAEVKPGVDQTQLQNAILIKASLTRAYTWQIGFKIFSMVALTTQFVNSNGVIQEKYYRAYGDKSNIWGAGSEYVTTLNYGINNLLPVMAKDLVSLCQGVPVEKYSFAGPPPPAPRK